MKKYIISTDQKIITLTVKNHYSIQYNIKTTELSLVSNNININTKVDHMSKKFKSIVFSYGGYDVSGVGVSSLVLCKDYHNTYQIREGTGIHRRYMYITMPSKVFKHLRYVFYDAYRPFLLLSLPEIHFRCLKQGFKLYLQNDKLLLDTYLIGKKYKKDLIDTSDVKEYFSKTDYLHVVCGDMLFHLSPGFRKSFKIGNQHFGFVQESANAVDIWEYFLKNPYTSEEKQKALKDYCSNMKSFFEDTITVQGV